MEVCPICKSPLPATRQRWEEGLYADCPRCGKFTLGDLALALVEHADARQRTVTSYTIRRMQQADKRPPRISSDDLKIIWQTERLPTPPQQASLLILFLGRMQPSGSDPLLIAPERLEAEIWCALPKESGTAAWRYIADYLKEERLITYGFAGARNEQLSVMLTLPGWSRYEELQRQTSNSRTAFMAMKFGKPELDEIFRDHLIPTVDATGFRLERLDTNPKPGLIDTRMEVEIRAARFMIADLTHGSYGAYWEAGFAAGLGKPVFYTCEKEYFGANGSHFDTNHHYTVLWEAAAPQKAMEELKAAIRRSLPADAKLRDDD
jgi:hypothetical protein